ncbi:hypothetical protein [Mycobacterium decipiens]|uniref:Uncharacterized protein n=1 Tax=Mycobacterium decipiens TaxID=1430326 RepID=A0A1X2LTH1_9MYCO|nr:hypothetical protein [Mycobacterium decipiens]OSC40180.1 hypothetical protein B8W66_13860 [Mycobacterium decipiens]
MFTLLVSWLLVACVPGLLMLATLGLGRLEKTLAHDAVTATDVAEFLEQAEAVDVRTLARDGMPEALEYLHRRQAQRLTDPPFPGSGAGTHDAERLFATDHAGPAEPGLPTRAHRHARSNPQFRTTRHINRV